MKRVVGLFLGLAIVAAGGMVMATDKEKTLYPAVMSKEDIAGEIFNRPEMKKKEHDSGNTTLSVTSLSSSDKKFYTGMYKSEREYEEYKDDETYGVDEFMYFLEGSVKLTSADGTVHVIKAGDAVTIPKEWKGIWDSDGYTKIWVIYSDDE